MLVEQSSTYHEAVVAVFEHVKTVAYVGPLQIEAMPLLGRILLLANRSELTDEEIASRMGSHDELRSLADQGLRSADTEVQLAGALILRWLDEPILAEMAAKNLILWAGLGLLRDPGR
jgi:hypothetical protein